ncbi:hypothetical protein FSP39_019759 [Pinctada imbricata]|uniref:PDZ domain-containing protein n=1 Tax=Pinctada imbricata TaxID=66713 RepID=A0AA89BVB9_PINIB|nr:hypothetical protein FSP39_019759 [Pinctada imbricata]
MILSVSGVTFFLFQSRFRRKLNSLNLFYFKPVHASSPTSDDESKTRSERFNFIADVVEMAQPAVVHLELQQNVGFRGMVTVSNGSGFIVDSDGLILTNAHVVANGGHIKVSMSDGSIHEGKVVAVDQVTDLATVKINATNLPVLKLGKSQKLRPGEWVIAMGSPLSLKSTVTSGIVSSVHRVGHELGMHTRNMAYIQHDAVINDGEAIGINTMKVTSGISFAIPSDKSTEFLEKAEKLKKRAESRSFFSPRQQRYLGVAMLTLTPSIIAEFQDRVPDFPQSIEHGVLIQRLYVGSPAYNAGLVPMDVIVEINGVKIQSTKDVIHVLQETDNLEATVIRGNSRFKVKIKL